MSTFTSRRLEGRRALVTGGGSGIGRATARRLASEGAGVVVVDVRPGAAEPVAADIEESGGAAVAILGDVRDEASMVAAVDEAVSAFGGLDTVVTCAGLTGAGSTDALSLEQWELVIGVNLTGTFLTVKPALPHLVEAGAGAVVTIGSVASLVAAGRTASYDASKGGVLQFTRALAAEYADRGIRANCVCPGVVATNLFATSRELRADVGSQPEHPATKITPLMKRPADPAEIAAVVAFLCSDDASFITGAAVAADGGYSAI